MRKRFHGYWSLGLNTVELHLVYSWYINKTFTHAEGAIQTGNCQTLLKLDRMRKFASIYRIIQRREVTSGPQLSSLKWSVSQQPPLIVATHSHRNLLLGLQLHLKPRCAICCCSQASHINTFKTAVCPTSSVLWDEARGLKLLGKKIITLVICVSGKCKRGESGWEQSWPRRSV